MDYRYNGPGPGLTFDEWLIEASFHEPLIMAARHRELELGREKVLELLVVALTQTKAEMQLLLNRVWPEIAKPVIVKNPDAPPPLSPENANTP